MLKHIPDVISPDLMHAMMSMGHADRLVLADSDFPADTFSRKVIRADGIRTADLLEAILSFFPLDPYVEKAVSIMAPVGNAREPEIWQEFRKIISRHDKQFKNFEYVKRFDFYRQAKESFVVVITGEPDGNLILQKGVVAV